MFPVPLNVRIPHDGYLGYHHLAIDAPGCMTRSEKVVFENRVQMWRATTNSRNSGPSFPVTAA